VNEREVLMLSSRKVPYRGGYVSSVVMPPPSFSVPPDGIVAEPLIERLDSKVRRICLGLAGHKREFYYCAGDPDAERIISLMEEIHERQAGENSRLLKSVFDLDKEVIAAKVKLSAYEQMKFWDRVKFVFKGGVAP